MMAVKIHLSSVATVRRFLSIGSMMVMRTAQTVLTSNNMIPMETRSIGSTAMMVARSG